MHVYVKVTPKASQNKIEKISEGEYNVWVTAPPSEGQANEGMIKVLVKHFGVAKSCVSIVGGKSARVKIVDVAI